MKKVLLTIGAVWALACVGEADYTKGNQSKARPNAGTIIVYRKWSLMGSDITNFLFNLNHGPDLMVRNGTYYRLTLEPGDYILSHDHVFSYGQDV